LNAPGMDRLAQRVKTWLQDFFWAVLSRARSGFLTPPSTLWWWRSCIRGAATIGAWCARAIA